MANNPWRQVLRRNSKFVDIWSLVHLLSSLVLGLVVAPWIALTIVLLWEPLELFVLSPLLARRGINFGYEHWRNVATDVFFDLVGIGLALLVRALADSTLQIEQMLARILI